jgi:predicted ATPase
MGYLIRHISSPALVIISTMRPFEGQTDLTKLIQTLKREDRVTHLHLSVLSSSAMQEIAAALSPKHEEQLSGWLMQSAEGNPFFLTELVRYAYEIGLLKRDGTLDTDLFYTSPVLPPTIQNLIESRFLRLSENGRHVLQLAAILGREFEFELVRNTVALPESDALDAIEELQAAYLIGPLKDDRFAFDHSLTLQVALQGINEARRRSFHRRVGEALEVIHRDQLGSASGLIAHHFMSANLPARAAPYAFRAGQAAANLAAWAEAIAFYEQALALETDETRRTSIFLAMGIARFHKGDFALASNDYQAAVNLAQASQDWTLLEQAHLGLNLSLIPQARYAESIAVARGLRGSGPPELALCAELIWATALSVQSAHPVEAERHLREAERLLQQQVGYSGPITFTQIIYQLAAVVGQQGRSLEAIDLYRKALDMMYQGQGNLDTLRSIMLYNNLAYHLHLVGDPAAQEYILKGIRLATEKGSLSHFPYLYSTSGEIALAQGDLESAEEYFGKGLSLAEQIPVPERIAGLNANLGLVARKRGEISLARERLQLALNQAEELGSHHLEVRIRIWLAPLLSAEEAHLCLEKGRAVAERNGLSGLLEEIKKLDPNLPSH